MATQPKKAVGVDIEALLQKRNIVTNASIQGALKKLEQQKQEEKEKEILENLGAIQENTSNAVEMLRAYRKKETAAKAYLTAVATAEQQFYQDADFGAYNAAVVVAISVFNSVPNVPLTKLERNRW